MKSLKLCCFGCFSWTAYNSFKSKEDYYCRSCLLWRIIYVNCSWPKLDGKLPTLFFNPDNIYFPFFCRTALFPSIFLANTPRNSSSTSPTLLFYMYSPRTFIPNSLIAPLFDCVCADNYFSRCIFSLLLNLLIDFKAYFFRNPFSLTDFVNRIPTNFAITFSCTSPIFCSSRNSWTRVKASLALLLLRLSICWTMKGCRWGRSYKVKRLGKNLFICLR